MNPIRYKLLGYSDESMPPALKQYVEALYRKGWQAYTDAGRPFGEGDIAMLIWYEFDQQTQRN